MPWVPDGDLGSKTKLARARGADKISISPDGSLLIASHPKDLALMPYIQKGGKSPSQILRINPETGEVLEAFADDRSTISGVSVAVEYNGGLLLDQISGDYIAWVRK